MKKWLWSSLLLLAVLIAGNVALPRYTVAQLEQAARNEDTERLRHYVDFPALRDNLQQRVRARLHQSMGDSVPPELDELFTAGANLFIGPLLQQLITPEGIGELLRGGRDMAEFERELYRQAGDINSPPPASLPAESSDDWHLQHWHLAGLNRAVADYGSGQRPQLRLYLERHGLRWRLVDIALLQKNEPH
ncbi:DUF2939 domain-containing protein [Microbulbifer sp. SAOS-129_SWC]|uniref:DUF2939 domain-containing protein n=1 Tax=Microbulbifer sp. SAOS-129_SWC TaxID=3145235 RepID=UPI0032176635